MINFDHLLILNSKQINVPKAKNTQTNNSHSLVHPLCIQPYWLDPMGSLNQNTPFSPLYVIQKNTQTLPAL